MAEQKRPFSLADLPPEPLEFDDVDGTIWNAKRLEDFGTDDQLQLTQIQRRLLVAMEKAQRGTEEKQLEAAVLLQQQLDAFIHLVAPDFPEVRIATLKPTKKLALLEWWKSEQVQLDPNARRATVTMPIPAPPSPDSSKPTFKANQRRSSRRRSG